MSVLNSIKMGQRLDVKALRNINRLDVNGKIKGTIKANSVCQLYRYFDNLIIGRDRYGNFTTYLETPKEGLDYELIHNRLPFPE